MPASQRVVQVCLFLLAAIGMFGGTLQMVLGQPDTTPRLDNVHRFMAGIYFGSALIALWAGVTVRRQGTLVFLIAIAVFLGAMGRLVSMSQVGVARSSRRVARLPAPGADRSVDHRHRALWLAPPIAAPSYCFTKSSRACQDRFPPDDRSLDQ